MHAWIKQSEKKPITAAAVKTHYSRQRREQTRRKKKHEFEKEREGILYHADSSKWDGPMFVFMTSYDT